MSKGWDVYYIVFLAGALGLVFPVVLGVFAWLLSPPDIRKKYLSAIAFRRRERVIGGEGKRINTRFFLAVNVASVLLALSMILIPCTAAFRALVSEAEAGSALRPVIVILSVGGFLALSLFYSVRKGDLSWLRTYRSPGIGFREDEHHGR